MKDTDIQLNEKNVPLRTAGFLLALAIAVTAFTAAISSIGKKDPGLYAVDASPDENLPLYATDVTLTYYFTGESDEIRVAMNTIRPIYSAALRQAYLLLDAHQTYEGTTNLASLNAAPGEPVTVGKELLGILNDAYARTCEQRGYNMFAGALYAEWESILILEDPETFDPVRNEEERTRLARLAAMTNDLGNFGYTVVDAEAGTVRIDVSPEYRALLRELEIDAPVLDLNVLRDAYELRMIGDALAAEGWRNGYLSANSGAVLALPDYSAGSYCLYDRTEKSTVPAVTIPAPGGSAFSQFRAFAYSDGEYEFYRIADGEREYWRHPYLPSSGEYSEWIASSCVFAEDGDVVEACYDNLLLFSCPDRAAAAAFAQGECPYAVGYLLRTEEPVVWVNARGMAQMTAVSEYGYRLSEAR